MALGGGARPISSMALQQGGLGMVLTVLLIVIPPMAANFFSGTLGQFSAYSQFGLEGKAQNPAVVGPQAAPRNAGQQNTAQQETFGGSYNSLNPGAQITGSGAGSTMAQPDQIKQKGSNA